jgi:hypothetical protein
VNTSCDTLVALGSETRSGHYDGGTVHRPGRKDGDPEGWSLTILSCDWPGWTCDPKLDALQTRLGCETDFARRKVVWEEIRR